MCKSEYITCTEMTILRFENVISELLCYISSPGLKTSVTYLIEMKFGKSNYRYSVIHTIRFEYGSFSLLRDLTSQSYLSDERNES